MDKLLRRVFPTRPALGLTLVVTIIGLIIATGVRAGTPPISLGLGLATEGAWFAEKDPTHPTACKYTHFSDEFTPGDNGTPSFAYPKQHHSSCVTTVAANASCPDYPVGVCVGAADQDHDTSPAAAN